MSASETPEKASTLEAIRRLCKPQPLEGDYLRYFVETDSARDPHQNTRKLISDALHASDDVRILFYGHRGCGKSTELNKLLEENREEFLPVKFDVRKEMPPVSVRAEDLILVILERVFATLNEREDIELDESILEEVYEYFAETTEIESQARETTATAGAGIDTGSALGKLVGLFATFRGDIKAGAKSETTSVRKLRQRPADLLAQSRLVFESARKGLKEKDLRLLVVVEGLDKVDVGQARELFVENVSLLSSLTTNIIYTIPIWLFHSPDAEAFTAQFDETVTQPMLKVAEADGETTDGFQVVRDIVLSRLDESVIEDQALDLLVQKTAGVLRHAFQVLHTAATMSDADIPLTEHHIEYGLGKLRTEMARQITLPRDGKDWGDLTVGGLLDRLAEYARKQNQGEPIPIMSDPVNQILLQSCALVEYNGEGWLGVHPLIVEHLKKMGRLS